MSLQKSLKICHFSKEIGKSESAGESENDAVSTDKEKDSKPHNPFIEYYRNQALTGQTYF